MLLFLAPELIQGISDQLTIDDIKRLRLTCKDLGNILASSVWRSLKIDIRQKTPGEAIAKLQILTKTSAASRGAKRLTIKTLAPKSGPKYQRPVRNCVDSTWIQQDTSPGDPPEVQSAKEMKKCLYNAVASLQCVQTVSWTPGQDDTWTHTRIMDALSNISSLQDLHIDISFFQADIPFHLFKNLRAISISGINNAHHYEQTFDNLAKMIAQSPQLDSISIDCGPPGNGNSNSNKPPSLRQFFKYYPKDLPPLRLRFLSVIGYLVHFDESTMPHFQYLRSLNWTANPMSHYPSLRTSAMNLWTTLCHNKVRLEEITIDIIVSEFIDYIGSFSGMKKLSVKTRGLKAPMSSVDATALSFYSALQRHVQSLEELHVITYCRGLWCFGSHNSTLISQCLKLEELRVRIAPQDIVSTPRDVIDLLVDTVTTSNPKLDFLRIDLAFDEDEDPDRNHNKVEEIERANRQMLLCIENYRAPISCTRLPSLQIDLVGVFVGCPANIAEGGGLRYRNILSISSSITSETRRH